MITGICMLIPEISLVAMMMVSVKSVADFHDGDWSR